jgi:hypothetical protein
MITTKTGDLISFEQILDARPDFSIKINCKRIVIREDGTPQIDTVYNPRRDQHWVAVLITTKDKVEKEVGIRCKDKEHASEVAQDLYLYWEKVQAGQVEYKHTRLPPWRA